MAAAEQGRGLRFAGQAGGWLTFLSAVGAMGVMIHNRTAPERGRYEIESGVWAGLVVAAAICAALSMLATWRSGRVGGAAVLAIASLAVAGVVPTLDPDHPTRARVLAFDITTGRPAWSVRPKVVALQEIGLTTEGVSVSGYWQETRCSAAEDALVVLDPRTGRTVSRTSAGTTSEPVTPGADVAVEVTAGAVTFKLDPETRRLQALRDGKAVWTTKVPHGLGHPLVVSPAAGLLVVGGSGDYAHGTGCNI